MGITQLEVKSPLKQVFYFDSAIGAVTDGIKSSPGTLYSVAVDNSGNSSATFVKLYDLNSAAVTVGTTSPDWCLRCLPNVASVFYFSTGTIYGVPFSVALSACATT